MLPDNIPFPRRQLILPTRIFQRNMRMVKAVQLFVGILVMPIIEEVVVKQRPPDQIPFVTVDAKFSRNFSSFKLHSATRIEWLCTDTLPCWIKLLVLLKLPDCRMSPPCFLRFLRSFACCRAHFRKASLRFCSLRSSFVIFRPSCADTRIYAVLLSALALFHKTALFYSFIVYHILPLLTTYKP